MSVEWWVDAGDDDEDAERPAAVVYDRKPLKAATAAPVAPRILGASVAAVPKVATVQDRKPLKAATATPIAPRTNGTSSETVTPKVAPALLDRRPPSRVLRFQWVRKSGSWRLLLKAFLLVGPNVVTLVLLFWGLMTQHDFLMRCDSRDRPISETTAYLCTYTKAYLRSFPLLALNVNAIVAFRTLLQTRMYYTLLQFEGLLDFADPHILRNPLLWVLGISLTHGVLHFILLGTTEHASVEKMQTIFKSYVLPAFLFMSLFYNSADIENGLVPLNKFFEEDYSYSRQALGSIKAIDERVVEWDVCSRDVLAAVEAASGHSPALADVARNIIDGYDDARERRYAVSTEGELATWSWFQGFWPARLLLSRRLDTGHDSTTWHSAVVFRIACFACCCIAILSTVGGCFAVYRLYEVSGNQGAGHRNQDIMTLIVYVLHIVFLVGAGSRVAWVLRLPHQAYGAITRAAS